MVTTILRPQTIRRKNQEKVPTVVMAAVALQAADQAPAAISAAEKFRGSLMLMSPRLRMNS